MSGMNRLKLGVRWSTLRTILLIGRMDTECMVLVSD